MHLPIGWLRPVLLPTFLIVGACEPDPPPASRRSPQAVPPKDADGHDAVSPLDTVRRVHDYRVGGNLAQIEAHLLPEQRPFVLELLLAVDQFLAADQALRASATRNIGPASAMAFDRSDVADMLGVFSHHLSALDETIDGDRAVVTIQVADRVPLQSVNLVRRADVWLIETDPPIPGAAREIRAMAAVLTEAAQSLAQKPITAAELQAEIQSRQAAVARRLASLARETGAQAP